MAIKRSFLALLALGAGIAVWGQQEDADPVVMTINGTNVTRSEFEYSFNKNNADGVLDRKSVEEYVPLFVDFRLKVEEAKAQHIDTISSVKTELEGYKEQMVLPTIVDSAYIEREVRRTYDNTAKRFGSDDMLTASHILFFMPQSATDEQHQSVKHVVDSIYAVLKATPSAELEQRFSEVARKWSQDKASAEQGGSIGQFGKGMMIPEFEAAAYALQPGQMSEPVLSTIGYHIIYMKDRHPFEPYEYHHDKILAFLEGRGIKEASASAYIDSIAKQQGLTRQQEIDILFGQLIAHDADSRYLAQEYHDGTLMYEVCKRHIWDKAQQDEAGQEAWYKSHKKNYKWDAPRWSGIIIHGKDAAVVSKAKNLLHGVKEPDWAQTIVDALNNDSVKVVRIERGLFKQGDNATVDNMAFGDKTKEVKVQKTYPETDIYGSMVKKPRDYKDVRGQVTTDYQNDMEAAWVKGLHKKFSVEIFDDVLRTVNNHDK